MEESKIVVNTLVLWVVVISRTGYELPSVEAAPSLQSLQDANSLMGFKSQIWSDPLASMSNWKLDPLVGHACFWNGVNCTDLVAYRVSSLQLSGVNLIGPLSSNLGTLTELLVLNLSDNGITGSIPIALGQCTKLTVLDLSRNSMTALVPNAVGLLTSLVQLYLNRNQFIGPIGFASTLVSLTELSLEYNNFTGYPFTALAKLDNITYLNLGFNNFSGTIDPSDITHFNGSLEQLVLAGNLFQGPIPSSVSYLTNLEALDLSNNSFIGSVLPEFQYCINLTYLNISYNNLNGTIPRVLGKLQSLAVLDLTDTGIGGDLNSGIPNCTALTQLRLSANYLTGSIPSGIGNLQQLNYLDLSSNMLSGTLPPELGSLPLSTVNLSSNRLSGPLVDMAWNTLVFDASNNNLTGAIPDSYAYLQLLQTLLLRNNQLSGKLPVDLGKSPTLQVVDLTGNNLTGRIPLTLAGANMNMFSVSSNFLQGEIPPTDVMMRFSPNAFLPGNPELCGKVIEKGCPFKGFPRWAEIILGIFPAVIAGLLLALLIGWLFPRGDISAIKVRKCTDDFNNANLIGVGWMSTVYKGTLPGGKNVAVKRYRQEYYKEHNFELERKLLLDLKHPNIVKVLGSCSNGLKALVLEHIPNGNLDMHLKNLSWKQRLDIGAGVAQGLAYLHGEWQSPHALHCDLKKTSILLDDKFNPKLTDIRLASSIGSSITEGSLPYRPPEYTLPPFPTTSGDVYAFGTLSMELLTGVKASNSGLLQWSVKQAYPHKLESVIDSQILDGASQEQIAMFAKIAVQCTRDLPGERPNMQDVLNMFRTAYGTPIRV